MAKTILRGFFMIPSGIIVVEGRFREMDRMLRPSGSKPYTFAGSPHEIRRGMQLPEEVLDTILTHQHELSHYRQLMSTPMGLMLWRAQNVISVNVNFLARHVTWLRPSVEAGFPLDRWLLDEDGLEKYERAWRQGATIDPRALPVTWYRNEGFVDYLRGRINEIYLTREFLNAVTGRPEITVGEFVELANAVFWFMNRRSDLKVETKWATRLPPETPLLGDGLFSGNEIIEAAARLKEHRILEFLEVPPERFENWQSTRIYG